MAEAATFPPVEGPGVTLRALPSRTRLVLRCDLAETAALARVAEVFGLAPPSTMLTAAEAGQRAALRLGPDEWLLLAEPGQAAAVSEALAGQPLGLVDISHGLSGFALFGPAATTLLNEGCPLDLDAGGFPPGACTRTLFGKQEILLWRRGIDAFEVAVARSAAAPLHALLAAAAAELDPVPPAVPA